MADITTMILGGYCCAECMTFFTKKHGYPVLCTQCYDVDPKRAKADGYQRAKEEER